MTPAFATRMTRLASSPIRDILNVIDRPDMVSFAGGLPDPQSFAPLDSVDLDHMLQYGPSEGEETLREHLARKLVAKGLDTSSERILILSGSQQGIDLVAKLLIEHRTRVAVESPTYLAALQVFSLFGATYIPFQHEQIPAAFPDSPPSLVYAIPTFQNPTGYVYSHAERRSLAALCDASDAVLFEDDPYGDLCYTPCERTPICSMVEDTQWIYQSSFSKTIAPGLRLGYLTCSESLYKPLLMLKQAADLHSNRVSQQFILSHLLHADASKRLAMIVERYREKRDRFNKLLVTHFEGIATWSIPKGGLFFWLTLNNQTTIDTRQLLPKAIEQSVAYMPGEPFYADNRSNSNQLRLNFSHADYADADRGLATLASLIVDHQKTNRD